MDGRDPRRHSKDDEARGLSLPSRTQRHMRNVYQTLAVGSGYVTAGAMLQMTFHIGGLLSMIAMFGLSMYFYTVVHARQDERTAYLAYYAVAGSLGLSLGPLVEMGVAMDPGIVLAASATSLAVFGGFTVASLMTPRRYLMYLGGIISSFGMIFLVKLILLFLFGLETMYMPFMLFGLAMTGAYVAYDTERMIERSLRRDRLDSFDVLTDAYELLVDLVMLFRRILILFMQSQREDNGGGSSSGRDRRNNKRQGYGGTNRR